MNREHLKKLFREFYRQGYMNGAHDSIVQGESISSIYDRLEEECDDQLSECLSENMIGDLTIFDGEENE